MGLKIAIAGEIRSGKDTVSDYIQGSSWGMEKLYFAEGIEKIIKEYFPEAFEGNTKPRKYYQDIGQFMRTINPLVWINHVNRKQQQLESIGVESFIVTDLRQMNEYETLKDKGYTVIKVEASSEIRIERMKQSGDKFDLNDLVHPIELQIRTLPCDYTISNNTTLEDLYEQVNYVLDELKGVI